MRIMVFDVPAETGGALTILKQFYKNATEDKERLGKETSVFFKEVKNLKKDASGKIRG